MAGKTQTRRSISIRTALHERMSEYCRLHKMSLSAFVEAVVSERLDQPIPPPPPKREKNPPKPVQEVALLPAPKKRPLLRPASVKGALRALPPPRSEVQMPQFDGPLPGYVPPIQTW